MNFTIINVTTGNSDEFSNEKIVHFLFTHLEEYGDTITAIQKCIDYVMHPQKEVKL